MTHAAMETSHKPMFLLLFLRAHAGWFFGDPHLQTLDGNDYTFNGYGEYRMIAADHAMTNTSAVVQARTTPLSGTTATVLTHAAMGIYNTTTNGKSSFCS